jgi:BirA family biotin operon repressor/biotin-[acetyl-CoA-carboxylase] ligase
MAFTPDKLIILDKVDSTNNYAMGMVEKAEAISGNVVLAMEQSQGKGTRGKHWNTRPGENILLSIIVEMQYQPVSRQFELIVAVALGVHDFIKKHISAEISIKWPNDLFINDSKAGGILIENKIKGTLWQWAVIGIGINVNQTDFKDLNKAANSFKNITDENYDVVLLGGELVGFVLERIEALTSIPFEKMLEEYNSRLFSLGKIVKLKKGNEIFETKILGVSVEGELVVNDGEERRFRFGEVEWLG